MVAQDAIDGRCRKAESLEPSRGRWIAQVGRCGGKALERPGAARHFVFLERRDRLGCGIAVDAFANQLADEPAITDGLAFSLDVEPSVETIVNEALSLRPFDRLANGIVAEALSLEPLPELSLGKTLARQQRERRSVRLVTRRRTLS